MSNEVENFFEERKQAVEKMGNDEALKAKSTEWIRHADNHQYMYNFTWMGRPIIHFPTDLIAMQELIWQIKPDVIVETGIAHGGSIIFSASMLELIGKGEVIAVDIDIRQHNRELIETHPMFKRITMIQGSSIDEQIINQIKQKIGNNKTVMVVLDSNHTHDHVLDELKLYGEMVSVSSYMICMDTFVEDMPPGHVKNRPWDKGSNPMTAVFEYLQTNKNFEIDKAIDNKLLISEGRNGYLKKVK